MPVKNIVRGQKVSAKQLENAKELRREMTPAEKILWKHLKAQSVEWSAFSQAANRSRIFCRFLLSSA